MLLISDIYTLSYNVGESLFFQTQNNAVEICHLV